jgi:hypothetical protein
MTTIDKQVAVSADDADERQDGTEFSSTDLGLWIDSNTGQSWRWAAGMRFTNITIPQGDVIDVAYISVQATILQADDPNIDIYCEDVDNSVNFTTNADVIDRTVTTASTEWDETGIGTGWSNSPSIVAAVQEVVNRGSWSSGNALTVICKGKSDKGTHFAVKSRDSSTTLAPKLHIEYSAGGLQVSVSDGITLGDSPSVDRIAGLNISTSDGLTIGESISRAFDPTAVDWSISESDGITIADTPAIQIAPGAITPTFIGSQKVDYAIWLDDQYGNRLVLLDNIVNLEMVRTVNAMGACRVTLPGTFDQSLIGLDSMVEFWRAPVGGKLVLETVFFIRQISYTEDISGNDVVVIEGPDANDLLNRRIVAYAAGTSQADKSDYADDMLKEIVDENLGSSATDSDRDLSGLEFTIAADVSRALGIEKGFSYREMMPLLQDIADMSSEGGIDLYFDVVPKIISTTQIGFEFQTFVDQRGRDRTYDSGNPVVFGKEWGNLYQPRLNYDYTYEWNYVYAGGQGEKADRIIEERSDSERIGASVWNRREKFVDCRDIATSDGALYRAEQKLKEGQPIFKFTASLLDTEQARYGLDWKFGDKVVIAYRGIQMTATIQSLRLMIDESGKEEIDVKMEILQ